MVCNKCGADTPDKAAFCPQCGAQLRRAGGASASRPAKAARIEPAGNRAADVPEEELWTGAYSPKAMTSSYVAAGLLAIIGMAGASFAGPAGLTAVGVGAVVAFGYLVVLMFYQRLSVHYRLTTHRLVIERGILSK